MYLNPVQQTPLPFDPARQALTPQPPINPLPQGQPATSPIQQGDTPQDKFGPRDGGGGNQQDGGTSDSQKAATAEQLHNAWLRLQQLKQQANQALLAGDARGARDAAEQAAEVAVQIQNLTGSTPDDALGPVEAAAEQISAHDATQSTGNGDGSDSQSGSGLPGDTSDSQDPNNIPGAIGASIPSAIPSLPGATPQQSGASNANNNSGGSVIDIARAGLDTANDVVDTAASVPQPAGDLASIHGFKQTVLKAIAGVEAIAARVLGQVQSPNAVPGRIDIRA